MHADVIGGDLKDCSTILRRGPEGTNAISSGAGCPLHPWSSPVCASCASLPGYHGQAVRDPPRGCDERAPPLPGHTLRSAWHARSLPEIIAPPAARGSRALHTRTVCRSGNASYNQARNHIFRQRSASSVHHLAPRAPASGRATIVDDNPRPQIRERVRLVASRPPSGSSERRHAHTRCAARASCGCATGTPSDISPAAKCGAPWDANPMKPRQTTHHGLGLSPDTMLRDGVLRARWSSQIPP